nr:hypothetical protein CFP56_40933 [Quercus suber]
MYSGVLHGLGNDIDDDENFIYVLSTLKERVLVEESLVPLAWYSKASFSGTEVAGLESFIGALNRGSYSSNQMMQGWAALKQGIQNEVRTLNFVSYSYHYVYIEPVEIAGLGLLAVSLAG